MRLFHCAAELDLNHTERATLLAMANYSTTKEAAAAMKVSTAVFRNNSARVGRKIATRISRMAQQRHLIAERTVIDWTVFDTREANILKSLPAVPEYWEDLVFIFPYLRDRRGCGDKYYQSIRQKFLIACPDRLADVV